MLSRGGAISIAIAGTAHPQISSCDFVGNNATVGGAMYYSDATLVPASPCSTCTFSGNVAGAQMHTMHNIHAPFLPS